MACGPKGHAISIHALLAESDPGIQRLVALLRQFLSTLSLRRATIILTALSLRPTKFLSTLSLRRATTWARGSRVTYVISIHALLAESDLALSARIAWMPYFYPRSPCGERPFPTIIRMGEAIFLSTLSLRRATIAVKCRHGQILISIHALLAESDSSP